MIIQIDPHTLERAHERGADEDEIYEVLNYGESIPAKYDRQGKSMILDFQRERNGKYYPHKKVEVYYIIENQTIITVTVYVFYGKWEV
jgi:hypothetical protein